LTQAHKVTESDPSGSAEIRWIGSENSGSDQPENPDKQNVVAASVVSFLSIRN